MKKLNIGAIKGESPKNDIRTENLASGDTLVGNADEKLDNVVSDNPKNQTVGNADIINKGISKNGETENQSKDVVNKSVESDSNIETAVNRYNSSDKASVSDFTMLNLNQINASNEPTTDNDIGNLLEVVEVDDNSGVFSELDEVEQLFKQAEKRIELDITNKDYFPRLWANVTIDLSEKQPILSMCCAKAEQFDFRDGLLKIGFSYDVNMLIITDKKNFDLIVKIAKGYCDSLEKLEFYLLDKPVDLTNEKIARLKSLFSSDILKITKK